MEHNAQSGPPSVKIYNHSNYSISSLTVQIFFFSDIRYEDTRVFSRELNFVSTLPNDNNHFLDYILLENSCPDSLEHEYGEFLQGGGNMTLCVQMALQMTGDPSLQVLTKSHNKGIKFKDLFKHGLTSLVWSTVNKYVPGVKLIKDGVSATRMLLKFDERFSPAGQQLHELDNDWTIHFKYKAKNLAPPFNIEIHLGEQTETSDVEKYTDGHAVKVKGIKYTDRSKAKVKFSGKTEECAISSIVLGEQD